ncbi:EamA-like transporter family protein [Antricoccus suffuscus]|uniref:EamA-like transporter family protein n=1 Tax=Antricoccus suffuscus TaxID=1629062 RepID=A0A2T0ZZA8_9ACTN|nr:EamA family transporter [Antricoccus suffuscus]PRZ41670.1 EamA-like transporter family protein [Antricoccus suffuscus]
MTASGHSLSSKTHVDRTWLVAIAAALWGLDGLLREPLAVSINPATVVLWEHVIIVVILSPFILPAMRVFARCSLRDKAAIVTIGVGASAVGTALFTQAFRLSAQTGDFITPLILQKLQPIFAVLLAVVLLRERLKPGFAIYAVPALVGAWLMTFAQPFDVKIAALQSALFAVGAAVLWASGTVLGRMVTASVSPRDMTVLRFSFGVIGAIVVVAVVRAPVLPGWSNMPGLVLLALIPGLLGLGLYYLGLRYTAASRATFAEMAFPATAAVVGVLFLGTTLTWSQWVGFAIVVATITALGWRERVKPTVEDPLLEKVI